VLDDNPLDEESLQLAKGLASSGCVVSMRKGDAIQARMAQLAADPEAFARNASGEDFDTARKAIFMNMTPYFEGVEATYEEDYCVSSVKLSKVETTEGGIQAVVTFLSGYEDPGKQWDFSCAWDHMIYTASKWFILNIGTFTFHNSHLRNYDEISRGIDETNRLLGLDKTIAQVEKPIDEHYWGMVGTEYMKAGRFEEAEKAFKKSVELDPTSAPAWGRLVIFFNNRGRKAEALDAVEKALQYAPAGWPGIEIMQKYRKELTD
jgi:tetratricopeptide (TPR) repeat protein